MVYTVKQLAELAGVSIRTLHYYDEIGLLKPSFIKENGYRYYEVTELLRLQQILFYRELEFSLEDILKMMNSANYDQLQALEDQKKLLEVKKGKTEQLLKTIQVTIKTLRGGEIMNNDDLFAPFTDEQMEQHKAEAKQRWGHTDAYKQSIERTKHWTKADYQRIAKQGAEWTQKLGALRDEGKKPESDAVQAMIAQHYEGLRTFYEPNYEMYKGLGQMYVDDPRFTAYYDKFGEGLAVFMRDAMHFFVEQQTK